MAHIRARTVPLQIQSKENGGRVYVEKSGVLDDLISTGIDYNKPRRYKTEVIDKADKSSYSPNRSFANSSILTNESQYQPKPKLDIKKNTDVSFKTLAEAERERKDKMFPVILDRVDQAGRALDDIEREMTLFTEAKNNKIRRQYEDWNTNVHGKIQKKIQDQIDATDNKTLNKKKGEDYEKFLNITNRKAAIFRDIIIESEYDPLEPNRRCLKAKTGKLKDPAKISALKAEEEASMLEGAGSRPKVPLGKETLAVELWASGQIEATPYGTFARMMAKANKHGKSGEADQTTKAKSATLRSHIDFDHYSFPTGKAAIDAEMPRGKRIHPEAMYSDPGRIFGSLTPEAIAEIRSIKPPESRTKSNIFG